MKRFVNAICCVLLIASLFSFAFAEMSGVFVPTYQTFMDRLCELSPEGYANVIRAGLMKDGSWKDGYMSNYDLVGKNTLYLSREVNNDYVRTFELTISQESYDTYCEDFDKLITAVMMAIRDDYTEEDVSAMKEALLISTIVGTPVNYMYQSANDGVYRYGFVKKYGTYEFSIEFALN